MAETQIYYHNIDLIKNILLNAKLNPLTSVERLALSLTSDDDGLAVWDSTLKSLFIWTGSAWIITGFHTFLELEDTPDTYSGQAGKFLRVNGDEDAVVFEDFEETDTLDSVVGRGSSTDKNMFLLDGASLKAWNSAFSQSSELDGSTGLVISGANSTIYGNTYISWTKSAIGNTLNFPTTTAPRTINFPDASGTVILNSTITYPVTSVFGRTGPVVAVSTDYNTFYPSFTGSYADPSWITSLTWSKIIVSSGDLITTLGFTPENVANKSISTSLGTSNTLYPTQNAVKTYVDAAVAGVYLLQGDWNANTNSPNISGVTVTGWAYRVSVAGTTSLGGITDWQVGDMAVKTATGWLKMDNTDAVTSVNGQGGAVSLTTTEIPEGTNLYWNNSRTLASVLTGYTSGAGTISSSDSVLSAIQKLNGNVTASTLWQRVSTTVSPLTAGDNVATTGTFVNNKGDNSVVFDTSTDAHGWKYMRIGNAFAALAFGIENTGGSQIIFGAPGDCTVLRGSSGIAFSANNGTTMGLHLTAAHDLNLQGNLNIGTIGALSTTATVFLTHSGNTVKTRTAAQVLSDIGAAPATGGGYLPLAGGSMTGAINMQGNGINFQTAGLSEIYPSGNYLVIGSQSGAFGVKIHSGTGGWDQYGTMTGDFNWIGSINSSTRLRTAGTVEALGVASGTTSNIIYYDTVTGIFTYGALPSLTGFVPYTGATSTLDLGTHNLISAPITINSVANSNVAFLTNQNAASGATWMEVGNIGGNLRIGVTNSIGTTGMVGVGAYVTFISNFGVTRDFVLGTNGVQSIKMDGVNQSVTISVLPSYTSGGSYVVSNSGILSSRTAAQVLSDIGAAASSATFTLGSTSIALGSTTTTVAGLTSVTSATFVGSLTGHASLDLALTGGNMSGSINMNSNPISNVTSLTASGSIYTNASYFRSDNNGSNYIWYNHSSTVYGGIGGFATDKFVLGYTASAGTALTAALAWNASGNVAVGNTTFPSLFSVGSTGQFQVNSSGNITGVLPAYGSAATLFVVNVSGQLQTRTAAEVLSDLGVGTGYVPYTGATANVNLGANTITALSITLTKGNSGTFLTSASATSGYIIGSITNTTGNTIFGNEGAAATLYTGANAYASVFGSVGATSVQLITANIARMTILGSTTANYTIAGIGTSTPVTIGTNFSSFNVIGTGGGAIFFGKTTAGAGYMYSDDTTMYIQGNGASGIEFDITGGNWVMKLAAARTVSTFSNITIGGTATVTGLAAGSAGNFVVNGGSGLLVTRTAAQVVTDLATPLAAAYVPYSGATADIDLNTRSIGLGGFGGSGNSGRLHKTYVPGTSGSPSYQTMISYGYYGNYEAFIQGANSLSSNGNVWWRFIVNSSTVVLTLKDSVSTFDTPLTINGNTTISTLTGGSAGNFVVNGGSGLLVTRTAAQVLSDIGAASTTSAVPYIGAIAGLDMGSNTITTTGIIYGGDGVFNNSVNAPVAHETSAGVYFVVSAGGPSGGPFRYRTASEMLSDIGAGASITSSMVSQEIPSGTVNGSNVTFTLAFTPINASNSLSTLHLYQNGRLLKITDDYTRSGITITMVTAPLTGDTLLATYFK